MIVKKIMLADDEDSIRALVKATLEDQERYELLIARDGGEALQIARAELPALLFLDVMMPVFDGVEVCRQLKQDTATAGIEIIMLTALSQDSERERALEAGADGYFTKPFSPTALLDKVEELLDRGLSDAA